MPVSQRFQAPSTPRVAVVRVPSSDRRPSRPSKALLATRPQALRRGPAASPSAPDTT